MGETRVILGIDIIKRGNGILLTKEHYVEKLLKKLGHFDVTPMNISCNDNTQLKKNKGEVVALLEYAQIIRILMHLINFTRPGIRYFVYRLSRYTYNLNHEHWAVIV
jgi:ascorbate-specific PTS system EIIC-type component UlaA